MNIPNHRFFSKRTVLRKTSRSWFYGKHFSPALLGAMLAALVWLLAPQTGQAEELTKLTAAQIETLLTGNTAVGKWDGTNYRQFFAADGNTIYAQQGSRSSTGRWRVNRSKNVYESWWQRSDWSGYPVATDGSLYYWISHSLPPQAFKILPGEQLVAAKE